MVKRERTFLVVATLLGLVLGVVLVSIRSRSANPEEAKVARFLCDVVAVQEKADAKARATLEDGSYMAIVREIEAARITPDPDGRAHLPTAYAGLAADNEIAIERRPDGRLLVIFPVWRGKGANFSGYLYASAPLVPADFHEIDWGAGGVRKQTTIGGLDYVEARPLHGPWYQVSRGVD